MIKVNRGLHFQTLGHRISKSGVLFFRDCFGNHSPPLLTLLYLFTEVIGLLDCAQEFEFNPNFNNSKTSSSNVR